LRFAPKFEVRSNFRKSNYIRTFELNKIINKTKKSKKNKKKDVIKKMAQAEEKSASIDSQVLFQTQAPEILESQVRVKEPAFEKAESQSIKKKLRKVFNNIKLNAKITDEIKCINDVKTRNDARIIGYRNGLMNI